MPEIPEIEVKVPEIQVNSISVAEIPSWQAMPPQSIPSVAPITLQLGFPVIEMPGCVRSRNTQPGNREAYSTDPKGNYVVCDGTMPAYEPLEVSPSVIPPRGVKAPAIDIPEEGKPTEKPNNQSAIAPPPAPRAGIPFLQEQLPCPPLDAIPLGSKNKQQTAVVVGYERVDGKCEAQLEPLDIPTIVGNYLPGAPVVATTATIAAVATTSAILVRPLGDFLLKAVKPIVKKTIKKINERLGKEVSIESVSQRREVQRSLRG